jgi:hypothetical protein
MMDLFGWINVALGLFAAVAGVIVLRGVFQRRLSCASTVRFLRRSLIASLVGLMPLTHHFTPVQLICILSVYCAGAAIVAWLKFGLLGRWRTIFALSVTAVLYFDCAFLSIRIFRDSLLFTPSTTQSFSFFQLVQFLFAAGFIVLGILAARKCQIEAANLPALGKPQLAKKNVYSFRMLF